MAKFTISLFEIGDTVTTADSRTATVTGWDHIGHTELDPVHVLVFADGHEEKFPASQLT